MSTFEITSVEPHPHRTHMWKVVFTVDGWPYTRMIFAKDEITAYASMYSLLSDEAVQQSFEPRNIFAIQGAPNDPNDPDDPGS